MGAIHQVNSTYYGGAAAVSSGHPDDDVCFAVGAGLRLNAPMISQGDYLQAQINYTQGALRYIFQTPNSSYGKVEGSELGFGVLSDAVYGGTTRGRQRVPSSSLTTAWNVNAAYEHFWNPQWRTSLYGGYAAVSYNDQGNRDPLLVAGRHGAGSGAGITSVAAPGCNNDWSTWWIGSRTQWNVTKDFYMGFDVLYSKLNSADVPNSVLPVNVAGGTVIGGNAVTASDVGQLAVPLPRASRFLSLIAA